MARLLILTDREGDDTDWKGRVVWRIIESLAESQHEVLVASPVEFVEPPVQHPRVNVIRPVSSWRLDQLPKLAKVLLTFQPNVVQTFAILDKGLWPKLSIWPYFAGMCAVMPGLKRVTTIFDAEDAGPGSESWHRQASKLVVFSSEHARELSGPLGRLADVVPLELPLKISTSTVNLELALIPASVSDWEYPEQSLIHVRDLLFRYPETTVKIIGGWGTFSASQRREGWKILEAVAARVQMREPTGFNGFLTELADVRELWLEPLKRNSWRFLLSLEAARQLGKKMLVASPHGFDLPTGSTANSLSRLYV